MYQDRPFRITPFISIYSFTHLVVDAACAFLLLGVLDLNGYTLVCLLLYNALAFVMQAPWGMWIDKGLNPRWAAIAGLVSIGLSFFFWEHVFVAVALAGIGNALYHVGGGSLVLRLKNKRTTYAGIYVAPGGIGLAIGSYLSYSQLYVNLLLFPILLIALALIVYFIKTPALEQEKEKERQSGYAILILAILLIPIAIRSLIGLSIDFPWKENQVLYILLIAAVALGKIGGGVLADKYGLMKIGVGGLIVSLPLLSFFPHIPLLGILGTLVLNFTMPITLIALLNVLPDNKGLSFGLSTTALFIGSLPVILGYTGWIESSWSVFSLIFLASVLLFAAFYLMNKLKYEP